MNRGIILVLLLTLLLNLQLQAQRPDYKEFGIDTTELDAPTGLSVGDIAPNFFVKDQRKNKTELKELLKEGPVIIIFFRGNWCPICSRYLSNLKDSLTFITKKGVKVVAVTPETDINVEKTGKKMPAELIIISDKNEKIMEDYKVVFNVTESYQKKIKHFLFTDIAKHNGKEKARLPVPATFIVDKNGMIVYRHFDLNYKNRASVNDILLNLP